MSDKLFCAVWMVTYNQELYVSAAIQSIIDQKTNVNFKIFIGDDNSTDRTGEICRSFIEKYPGKMELIVNHQNIGSIYNGVKTYYRCFQSGAKYVALLEGDDCWLDPNKLQKQIEFLEANLQYVGCFHNAKVINGNGFVRLYNDFPGDIIFTQDEIVKSLEIPTGSVLFRNVSKDFPEWLLKCPLDITIYYYLAGFGNFYGSKDIMSVYRIHEGGIWTGQKAEEKINNHIRIRCNMLKFLPLSKVQERSVKQIVLDGRLQRMKYLSNTHSYNTTFFKDFFQVLKGKILGFKISCKYLLYCMVSDKLILFFKRFRNENIA